MSNDPISAVFDFGSNLLDKFIADPKQKAEAKFKLAEMQQNGELAKIASDTQLSQGQIDINKEEAKSASLFVSGWRPFVGWVCGLSFCYAAILEPILRFTATVLYNYTGSFPVIDTTITMQVLFGILGLGAMRMNEKVKGVASK